MTEEELEIKEEFERLVKEEEGEPTENTTQTDDTQNDDQTDNQDDSEEKKEPEFKADSIEDFLAKTSTKATYTKEGCMPSPIFGNRDTNNHNKYRVTLKNDKGSISFLFWDSIANTKAHKDLNINDAIASFGMDLGAIEDSMSYQDFKSQFYDQTEEDIAQRAFNGCRKQAEKAKKLFDENQIKELIRLSSEY